MIQTYWNGFKCQEFLFEGHEARVVCPTRPRRSRDVAIKTEYWDAFPATEIALVQKGFHLACIRNDNRWCTVEDTDRRARFLSYIVKEYRLNARCVPVGYSLGGAQAIAFAGRHSELVSCLYLDAPVVDFVDFPGSLRKDCLHLWEYEFSPAYPGITREELPALPENPRNNLSVLLEHQIPLVLSFGPEDDVVPFSQNGRLLQEAYTNVDLPFLCISRDGQGHHPHGLPDPSPIVAFIQKVIKQK